MMSFERAITHAPVLAAALVVSVLAASATAQPAPEQSGGFTVTRENGVTIYRGVPTPPPVVEVAEPEPIAVVAGQTVWLVNAETGKITGCRIRNTADHGRRRLSCIGGHLR